MKIGLDLSSLQGPHRMRGIGATVINFINALPAELRKKHSFIFYVLPADNLSDPLELLRLKDMQYEVRYLVEPKRFNHRLPGKLNVLIRLYNQWLSYHQLRRGDPRIADTSGLDAFLQTDQMVGLPRGNFIKAFIAYDLIPYILEWEYLWNYKTARAHGLPLQAALRCEGRRRLYISKVRQNIKQADKIFSISNATKQDYIRYAGAPAKKLLTVPLGVSDPEAHSNSQAPYMHRYIPSSWGYIKRPYSLDNKPFLLFVGGADKRRRLDELVTAFNHLRARGHDIELVLAGDTMQGPLNIPTENIQNALRDSSYIDDIVFMGFVDDAQREWLYEHALAFVYPSKYEGFGLPILEAMQYGTPVITYKNSSISEIADEAALYASDYKSILGAVLSLISDPTHKEKLSETGKRQASQYSWNKTAETIIGQLGDEES